MVNLDCNKKVCFQELTSVIVGTHTYFLLLLFTNLFANGAYQIVLLIITLHLDLCPSHVQMQLSKTYGLNFNILPKCT